MEPAADILLANPESFNSETGLLLLLAVAFTAWALWDAGRAS